MKKILVLCLVTVLCLTFIPPQLDMPFGESSVVEASVKKQFNKAGKIFMSRSQKAQVVATVKKGQAVTLIETSGSWGKVRYGKKTGWTAKSNLGDAKKRVAVDRLAPSVFFEKVRVHPLFFEAKKLYPDDPISYKYQIHTHDKLHVFFDKQKASMFSWFGDAYKPGVTKSQRDAIMSKHYESLKLSGELMYGVGTQESIDYAEVAKAHMVKIEKVIQADWKNRMKIDKQGTFVVNGDRFNYYMAGPGLEIYYK